MEGGATRRLSGALSGGGMRGSTDDRGRLALRLSQQKAYPVHKQQGGRAAAVRFAQHTDVASDVEAELAAVSRSSRAQSVVFPEFSAV